MKKSLLPLPLLSVLFSCNTLLAWQSEYSHADSDGDYSLHSVTTELKRNHQLYAYLIDQNKTMDSQKTVCGFPVSGVLGRLDTYHLSVVEFLFSDSTGFIKDYQPVKQPFYPVIALKPDPRGATAYLLSLGTEEIAISHNDSSYLAYKIADIDNFNRFYKSLITNLNKK